MQQVLSTQEEGCQQGFEASNMFLQSLLQIFATSDLSNHKVILDLDSILKRNCKTDLVKDNVIEQNGMG